MPRGQGGRRYHRDSSDVGASGRQRPCRLGRARSGGQHVVHHDHRPAGDERPPTDRHGQRAAQVGGTVGGRQASLVSDRAPMPQHRSDLGWGATRPGRAPRGQRQRPGRVTAASSHRSGHRRDRHQQDRRPTTRRCSAGATDNRQRSGAQSRPERRGQAKDAILLVREQRGPHDALVWGHAVPGRRAMTDWRAATRPQWVSRPAKRPRAAAAQHALAAATAGAVLGQHQVGERVGRVP